MPRGNYFSAIIPRALSLVSRPEEVKKAPGQPPMTFDNFVNLLHQADGLGESHDDLQVVRDVILGEHFGPCGP